ncbi:zinc metalloprotease [Nautilia profundicola AmH]|uniref:Zinc metalloprotease n=1 Tax=Nautilia profundicola (strain ATCC BAA-1463 / DSM 18972 / AmH) TaxID=598659 RepID=B9L834_NAUPA|nr:M48 family metallopeptidase [Nautilia profundicola]ACM92533.1 zinc metalloprotease [Nautilia profundicola AmH]
MEKLFFNGIEIRYKIVKKPIKNLYMEIKEDFVEVRCNRFVPKFHIEKFILKHAEHIIHKLSQKEFFYLFGTKYDKNGQDVREIFRHKLPPIILHYVKIYSEKMNLYPSKISFRFNKTRWGSCSPKNGVSFNYYLAQLPEELIEYVVVHELAHIKHKNHSKEFWKEVEKYLPDVTKRRKDLRKFEKLL